MVATISKLNAGNMSYYTKDYYLDGLTESEWLRTRAGCKLRHAEKPVTPQAFQQLLRGFHPAGTGKRKLAQNAGDKSRQPGWDVQFGIDKSFSVLYGMLPQARPTFERCLKQAVFETIVRVLEPEFLETRRGKGGMLLEKVSSPVATFLHRTNRDDEVHLHCHAVIPNVGLREDGTWGTIVSWNFYAAKHALGKAFHASFANLVDANLGIECELDEKGLSRVKGFPKAVAQALSTPSRRIAEFAEDDSAKAKERANLEHRPTKSSRPFEEVEEECRKRAAGLGFVDEDAWGFLGRSLHAEQVEDLEAAREVILKAVADLPPAFSKAQLFERAFPEGARTKLPLATIKEAIEEMLADEATLEPLGRVAGREQYLKLREAEADQEVAPEHQEPYEEKFREYVGRLIDSTPELSVAEFSPHPDPWSDETALERESERIHLEAFGDAAAELGARPGGSAVVNDPRARAELMELFKSGVEKPSHERLLDDASPTLVSLLKPLYDASLADNARTRVASDSVRGVEGKGPARTANPFESISINAFVANPESSPQPASEIPEAKARSFIGDLVEKARGIYLDRYIHSALAKALEDVTQEEAHFTRRELLIAFGERTNRSLTAMKHGGLDEKHMASLEEALADPSRVVPLRLVPGKELYTTPEMLNAEAEGFRAAGVLQERAGHRKSPGQVEERLAGVEGLTEVEREAVKKALSGNDLVLIRSDDGLQMQAVQRGIREALRGNFLKRGVDHFLGQKDIIWLAPTATAVRQLQREVGAEQVATMHKLLYNLEKGFVDTIKHHGTMMVNAALGMPTWSPRQMTLTADTTIVLDSSSFADTRLFSKLIQHAERAGARIIACGTHEMPSHGPGGFFHDLCKRSKGQGLVALSEEVEKKVENFPCSDSEEAKAKLIERWTEEALKRPRDHIIVAESNSDVYTLNAMAQAQRKEARLLGYRSVVVRHEHDGTLIKERVYEGDRIVFRARTDRDVLKGVFGTVKHIDLITGRMKVELDVKAKKYLPWEFSRQKTIEFQYRKYRFFQRQEEGIQLGYAATVHRSQNVAVQGNSYCFGDGTGGSQNSVYVGLGLARGKTYFFGSMGHARNQDLYRKRTAHAVQAEAKLSEKAELRNKREAEQAQATEQKATQGLSMKF